MADQEFDHIIVGAGFAGCVIARRLVDAGRKVALVRLAAPTPTPRSTIRSARGSCGTPLRTGRT